MTRIGKALGVDRIPTSVIVCGTVIICMEIIGVVVNVETHRDTNALISWLATINAVLFGGGALVARTEKGNQQVAVVDNKVDRMLNGELEDKFVSVMTEHLPPLVGAILDARGVPINAPVVDSRHDTHHKAQHPSE